MPTIHSQNWVPITPIDANLDLVRVEAGKALVTGVGSNRWGNWLAGSTLFVNTGWNGSQLISCAHDAQGNEMSMPWLNDAKNPSACTPTPCSNDLPINSKPHATREFSVYRLLLQREICSRRQGAPKTLWQDETLKWSSEKVTLKYESTDVRQSLSSWVEAKSLRHLSADYCSLLPPPRSTIAAAFSFNGKTLASTHGDHTVKIIDYQTGKCLKVLSGHRRTPWVVRFHPIYPEILASGSLDHEVRLWDATTADCIASRDFYRPIASIAFHAQGEILAVASGHKLYTWNYNGRGESFNPTVVLRTRRSLRAVHFHPHAAPFLLTAEVNDLDSPDTPLTLATTSGYLNYPAPALIFTNIHSGSHPSAEVNTALMPPNLLWPASLREHSRATQHDTRAAGSNDQTIAISLAAQRSTQLLSDDVEGTGEPATRNGPQSSGVREASSSALPSFDFSGIGLQLPIAESSPGQRMTAESLSSNLSAGSDINMLLGGVDGGQFNQFMSSRDGARWELPFFQGWLMGQSHAGMHTFMPNTHTLLEGSSGIQGIRSDGLFSNAMPNRDRGSSAVPLEILTYMGYPRLTTPGSSAIPLQIPSYIGHSRSSTTGAAADSSEIPSYMGYSRGTARSGVRLRRPVARGSSMEGIPHLNIHSGGGDPHSGTINVGPEIVTSITSDSSTDLPCTVKLKLWTYDAQSPSVSLDIDKCRLTIPHAVLCSEMGAHFSPCGRFLAACVACVLPHLEVEPGLHAQSHCDASETSTSPTRHPISGHRVIYELRIYSLEEATFGLVLASRAIRAAHCLTSIQFSPTSEHIMLAYGRRHGSLLRSYFTDGETKMHIYTILEMYRVSDMELVKVFPSADDEVNVACFHPLAGCGLVYGTKEGKLRILRYDASCDKNGSGVNSFMEDL